MLIIERGCTPPPTGVGNMPSYDGNSEECILCFLNPFHELRVYICYQQIFHKCTILRKVQDKKI